MNSSDIKAALSLLGIERFALAIHDQSFPSIAEEETGRGSPYSQGALKFFRFLSDLGFNAVQFGPQGRSSRDNPSPYDSTLFSKNELSISLWALSHDDRWHRLLPKDVLAGIASGAQKLVAEGRDRTSYHYAWDQQHAALNAAFKSYVQRREKLPELSARFENWKQAHHWWLHRDGLYQAFTDQNGTDDWRRWSEENQELLRASPDERKQLDDSITSKYAQEIESFSFEQFASHEQHGQLRAAAKQLGIRLYGDLQIGFSHRDWLVLSPLLMPGYLLGAPPSRTNPDGQPWGYPVLNPDLYFDIAADGTKTEGPALRWFRQRIDKMLVDFDGIRIDHPHGLVCPWVYRSSDADPLHAVQNGARLFESPDIAEHPELARLAIAQRADLNADPTVPRYADNWVVQLSEQQVARYATMIGLIRSRMSGAGFNPDDLICEVLSSSPYPLIRVLQSFQLGRFRVTQKAQPKNPSDIYRSDAAAPADWIMVGTHDTKPLWLVVEEWSTSEREAWAAYLAGRLQPDLSARAAFAERLVDDQRALSEAMLADLFVGPAKNVSVFFADLLGEKQIYNKPGVVNEDNWMLSVPNDFEHVYRERVGAGKAFNVARALSMALRARSRQLGNQAEQLARRLESD